MSASSERSSELERKLELVVQTGLLLTKTHDLEAIVQSATDAGLELCGAQFGAFFYNVTGAEDQSYRLYTFSGAAREKFADFPQPRNFEAAAAVVRSGDITKDPRYGKNAPCYGMPDGHPPVRSYLAVPIKSQSGEVLGGLFYGHADADVFEQSAENLIAAVAAQAGIAIENSHLRDQSTSRIASLEEARKRKKDSAKPLGELAAIIESSEDAIISKDLNGIVTSWNAAATRILGYAPEEIIGESILKVIPPHLHSDEPIILGKIRSGQRIEHFETVRQAKNGELLDVSLTVSPIKDETGEIIGASKILRDISSRKRLETSLLQAEKIAATGRMAATIAHEINNPLEAVLNLLYLLRPLVGTSEGRTYLSTAEIELGRVSHIAKQTLGYYREHASAVALSLSEIAEHAITVYGPRCHAYGIRIERALNSSTKIVLRRGEIMQVVSNLIANAISAMPDGGILRISANDIDTPCPGVCLAIEDNGVGIAPENLPRIFDAFFTTRITIGTGIGLFVAKQFVEGHGGEITIDSSMDTASHGTRVSVFLPLHTSYETSGAETARSPSLEFARSN
ncbi:MAG TPA: PAS domain S-box protein [Acidobacteriaceae bacterium]|jgi:PAS domain S-box-containing protein|nr:PAS domain S-box protein [Acidobacteriaceae bacterium]